MTVGAYDNRPERESALTQNVYFVEDQRWPSRSQRFSWLMAIGVVVFIIFELNLLAFEPLAGSGILLVLLGMSLVAITVQQRLSVKIGRDLDALPGQLVVQRFWRRAVQAAPVEFEELDLRPAPAALRIVYISKGPLAALSPGRRGSRLGRRDCHIPMDEIENWSVGSLPRFVWLRRARASVFPVGAQRDAVVVVLKSGEKLMIPSQIPATFIEALSAAKVDSLKKEQVRPVIREEI